MTPGPETRKTPLEATGGVSRGTLHQNTRVKIMYGKTVEKSTRIPQIQPLHRIGLAKYRDGLQRLPQTAEVQELIRCVQRLLDVGEVRR